MKMGIILGMMEPKVQNQKRKKRNLHVWNNVTKVVDLMNNILQKMKMSMNKNKFYHHNLIIKFHD